MLSSHCIETWNKNSEFLNMCMLFDICGGKVLVDAQRRAVLSKNADTQISLSFKCAFWILPNLRARQMLEKCRSKRAVGQIEWNDCFMQL